MLSPMEQKSGKGLRIAYAVVAVLMALMMCFSASFKFRMDPRVVHSIHEVIGVPLPLLYVLAILEIAGGVGLLAGILRPMLGVAGAAGLVCYFIGALLSHVRVADWAGITAPIVPLLMACAALALALRVRSLRAPAR
jgi:hypothetical protein